MLFTVVIACGGSTETALDVEKEVAIGNQLLPDIEATVEARSEEAIVVPTPMSNVTMEEVAEEVIVKAKATSTPTATPVPARVATISHVQCDVGQLDVTMFAASSVPKEETDLTKEWICLSVRLFFDRPHMNWEMANPIYIAALDRNNIDSAIELEKVYCEHIKNYNNSGYGNNGYNNGKCSPDYDPKMSGCNYGLCLFTTKDGRVAGSSISSNRHRDGFYLFISKSHDMPEHHHGYKVTTLHEMFHVFQQSNISRTDHSVNEFKSLLGKRSGDNKEIDVPWWNEGTAVYLAHLNYSRQPGEINDWLIREGTRNLWSDYGTGRGNLIDQYQESGRKLYNLEYGGSDHQVAYRVGFWFVAYLIDQVGEDKIYDFYGGLEENGFEKSFEIHFGKSYKEHVEGFDIFLTKSKSEILSIIPQ